MAYINKDNVIDIIDNSADLQEVKSCVFMLDNADVIERSKVDKAKTNIETMLEAEKQKDGTYTEVGKGIAIALGLLKHNIGE